MKSALDTGNTAWLLTSAALVLLMIPGLAFFYGGMVRQKSVLNMLMMVMGALFIVGVLWTFFGYGMAFGTDAAGATDNEWLGNVSDNIGLTSLITDNPEATYPAMAFVAFQAMFACITVGLIAGAIADRARFWPWMLFAALWATLVYFPVKMNLDAPELMSGPFHDSLALSYACDYGMIFIRCKDGISHNPLEFSSYEDLSTGTEVLYGTVLDILNK